MSAKIVKPGVVFNRNGFKKYKIEFSTDDTFVGYKRSLLTLGFWKFFNSYSLEFLVNTEKNLNEQFNLTLRDIYVIDEDTYNKIINQIKK